jgi:hypothetical protein
VFGEILKKHMFFLNRYNISSNQVDGIFLPKIVVTKPEFLTPLCHKIQAPPEIPKTIFQPFDSHSRYEPVLQPNSGKIYSWKMMENATRGEHHSWGGPPKVANNMCF